MYRVKYAKGKRVFLEIKKCEECGKEFVPAGHKKGIKFCSYVCSNTNNWRKRERKVKEMAKKNCEHCGKEFERSPKHSNKQWAEKKYCSSSCTGQAQKINDGLTTPQRARLKKGMVKKGTPEWLEKIKARTSEAMQRPDVQEKIRQPKGPMTDEGKIIRSDALVGILPKNMAFGGDGKFKNVQRGDYECSKGTVFFRSKWEANYALFLDFLKEQGEIKDWEYETETFFFEKIKLGTRSYRPDFPVINMDDSKEYHEVKGYMDARSQTKLKRMAKYFPHVKLVLIDRQYYTDMLKKMKHIIKFY